jgi:phosphoglycerate dehydrogenase-like enzyme
MVFRVALSGDFIGADGQMQYPMVDLTPFDRYGIEYEFVDIADFGGGTMSKSMVPASSLESFDALILLAASFTLDSVPKNGRLKCVARFGVGFDNVDVDACTAADIAVTITPDGVRRPVAVSVVNFMLTLASRMLAKDRLTRQGADGWSRRSQYMGVGVTGKTLGLLGLGNIGAEITSLSQPFGVKVIAADPFVKPETAAELGVEMVSQDELFERSDFISINCPLTDETKGLVNKTRFAQMKDSAFLINTARGPIVDETDLLHALESDVIAGAAIDVFEEEPSPASNPLFGISSDKLIVTPHSICWTDECFAGIGASCIDSCLAVARGEAPLNECVVNKGVLTGGGFGAKLRPGRL